MVKLFGSKIISFLFVFTLIAVLSGCGGESEPSDDTVDEANEQENTSDEPIVFQFGHMNTEEDNIHKGLLSFKEAVEERTNGEIQIDIFPNGQLGENTEVLEQVRLGGNMMTQFSVGSLGEYVPNFDILLGPFLYEDWEQAQKLLKSDLVAEWEEDLAKTANIRILGYFYFGERDLYTIDTPVRSPEDLQGLSIRVQPVTMYTEMIEAMGGAPTPMPWPDVYNALEQGVFDGAEAPPHSVIDQKHYEVINNYSITKHMLDPSPIAMNEEDFQSLSEEHQTIIMEEAQKALDQISENNLTLRDDSIKHLEEQGVTIIDDVDRDAFKEVTQKVYDQFPNWSPNLYEEVNKILNN